MGPLKHVLAGLCSICPFCIAARKWPKSGFARILTKVEKNCPACKAYRERTALRRDRESDAGESE